MAKKDRKRQDEVVTIRINPLDCISVLDVLEKQGIPLVNLSFSQAVKIVLASALETLRGLNYIPIPDGFTYLQRMAPFEEYRHRVAMLNITDQSNRPDYQVKPLFEDFDTKRRRSRYEELMIKQQAAPESFTDDADIDELAKLVREFG